MSDLGILIVTLERRRPFLDRLLRCLDKQRTSRVNVHALPGGGTIGAKRQRLLEYATESYVCFIDDDDLVSGHYVVSILEAIDRDKPDAVGFRLRHWMDDIECGTAIHSVVCKRWATQALMDGKARHFRTPNHLNPVKREMALEIGYLPLNSGEDADFSHRLYRKFPDMRETFIDDYLYYYLERTRRVEHADMTLPPPPRELRGMLA